jgi:glutathione S-transferase
MLKIWGRASSSNVQKLLWFCDEIGLAYERIDAGLAYGVTKTPEYLAMNPNALVPTIDDAGFVLWESNTILRYLAAKTERWDWYARGLQERAEIEKWMDWTNSSLAAAITPIIWQLYRTPTEQRDPKVLTQSTAKATQLMGILDHHFSTQPYAAGDRMSLADIPMAIQTYRWMVMPWDQLNATKPELPFLQTWYQGMTERPVFQKVVMIGLG